MDTRVIDDLNATRYFVENSQTDIVLIFSDLRRVQNYFQYLNTAVAIHVQQAKK